MTASPSRGAKLPRSPDRQLLRRLTPPVFIVPAGTTIHRIYFRGGPYASTWKSLRYFGPADARFDHHKRDESGQPFDQEGGIIYLARDIPTALAELFQVGRLVDRHRHQPWLVSFAIACDICLLDLTGVFCLQAGGSMKLISGPKIYAQNWSRAFYACYGSDGFNQFNGIRNFPNALGYASFHRWRDEHDGTSGHMMAGILPFGFGPFSRRCNRSLLADSSSSALARPHCTWSGSANCRIARMVRQLNDLGCQAIQSVEETDHDDDPQRKHQPAVDTVHPAIKLAKTAQPMS